MLHFKSFIIIKLLLISFVYSYTINSNKKYIRDETEIESNSNNSTQLRVTKTYYGDQLNSFESEMYWKLKEQFESEDSIYNYRIYDVDAGEDFSSDEISRATFRASSSLIMDNPEYFWLGNGCKHTITYDRGYLRELRITFDKNYEESQIPRMKNEVDSVVSDIMAEVRQLNTTCDKVKYIHDYLVRTIKYDIAEVSSRYNIYGSLIDKLCVCEGYAEAFTYLSQMANITAITVNSQMHEWNFVRMDDNQWYVMDVTYDDPQIGNKRYESGDDGNMKYDYFLIGKNTLVNNDFQKIRYRDSPDHQLLDYLLLENARGFEYPELADERYECHFSLGHLSLSINHYNLFIFVFLALIFLII